LQSVDLPTQAQVVVVQVDIELLIVSALVHPLLSKSVQAVEKARMELIRFSHLSPQQAVALVADNLLVAVQLVVLAAVELILAQAQQIMAVQLLHQVKVMLAVITVRARHLHQQVAVELVA
jgi:hypothetical protein